MRHKNVIPYQHFKKHSWKACQPLHSSTKIPIFRSCALMGESCLCCAQQNIKTWFDQPARKHRRRKARLDKAKREFPRPAAGDLRPVVRGQTARYNKKLKEGKGFTFEELKEAGIPPKVARTIGIAVDKRRRNRSEESLERNVERLKAYKSRLVLYPRKRNAPKAMDSSTEETNAMTEETRESRQLLPDTKSVMPIESDHSKGKLEMVELSEEQKAARAYAQIRQERSNQRWSGVRQLRREKEEQERKEKEQIGGK